MSDIDDIFKRINIILTQQHDLDEEPPDVDSKTLKIYCDHLNQCALSGILLTGIEPLGYFSWEESFMFGYGSEKDHKETRVTRAACEDKFTLLRLSLGNDEVGIMAAVQRVSDKKSFMIPLMDLKACDMTSTYWQELDDYVTWMVNFS